MKADTNATVCVRVDRATKERASKVLDDGHIVSYAIRLLMACIAEEQRLPIEIKVPSKTSQIALDEIEAGKTENFDSVDALMADLNAES